jgi:hypothetical protein
MRPADQHLRGGHRPDPKLGQQHRRDGLDESAQLLLQRLGLGVCPKCPLGGQPQRLHSRPVLHRRSGFGLEDGTSAGLPKPGPTLQRRPQRLGGGHQQRLEVAAGVGGHLDRARAGQLQHAEGLSVATLARAGQVLTTERLAAGADRVQRVALGTVAAWWSLGPVDLGHPLAITEEEAGQPGAVAAAALQRPAAAAGRMLADKAHQLLVAGLVARDLELGDHAAVGVQDGGGVGVAVGVDPDDMVDLAF